MIYKYRSLSGEYGRSEAENIILNSLMYWQSPSRFNDPFDCAPRFSVSRSMSSKKKLIDRAVKNNMIGHSRRERRSRRSKLMKEPYSHWKKRMLSIISDGMHRSAVSCFSARNDSLLMWAHYANSHQGLCFEFQETEPIDGGWFSFPVEYIEERPALELTEEIDVEAMKNLVFKKSTEWAYEEESRMFEYRGEAGSRLFPPKMLQGIIFGSRTNQSDRDFVKGLLAKREDDIATYEAIVSETKFHLGIVKVKT